MSSVAPPRTGPPSTDSRSKASGAKSTSEQLISARIVEACKALWWAEVVRSLLRLVISAIVVLFAWVLMDQWVYSPGSGMRTVFFAAICGCLVWYLVRKVVPLLQSAVRPEYAARSLERDMPELRQGLTSYVTLRGDESTQGLRSRVVRSIGAAAAGRLRQNDELPQEATGTFRLWIATSIALAILVAYAVISPKNSLQSAARLAAPLASIEPAMRVSIRDVQPGDAEAIAGRELSISASIKGIRDDEEAYCYWELPSGRQQLALSEDPETRRHAGMLRLPHSASGEVLYTITAGDASAGPFRLLVQDVPVVALESVRYEPPSYTQQSPRTSSTGAITALEGTRVTIQASTNRAIDRAKIEFNPRKLGESIQATAGATEMTVDATGTELSVSFPLRSARGRSAAVAIESYRIKVKDSAGQSNPEPIIYPIRVIADLPPDIAIMMPVNSPQDVPIDIQQAIEIHASDPDYGLTQIALEIRSGIDLIAQPVLWSLDPPDPAKEAKGNRVAEYGFRPAQHDLRVGDTVEIVAVAIDNRKLEHDPSVEPNVTRTDPIELRITAADPAANDSNSPDQSDRNQPQKQDSSKQDGDSSSGGQGQQQSGGGGGGGSGEQQSGEGGSGGDSSGQSESGNSGDQKSGEGGSGAGGSSGESDPNQDPSNQTSDGQQSSGQDSGSGASDGGNASDGQGGDTGASGGKSNNDIAAESEGQVPTEPDAQGEGNDSQGGSAQGATGSESPEGDPASTPSDNGGEGQRGSDPNSKGGENSRGGENSNGDPTAGAGDSSQDAGSEDGGGEQNEAPKHDGETFERIRDYLEQKRKEQQEGSGGGSQSESGQQEQQESSGAQGGDQNQTPDGSPGNQNSSGDSQSSGGQPRDPKSGDSQRQDSSSDSQAASGSQSDQGGAQSGRDNQSGDSQTGGDQTGADDHTGADDQTGGKEAGDQSGSSSEQDGGGSGSDSSGNSGSKSQSAGQDKQGSSQQEQGGGQQQDQNSGKQEGSQSDSTDQGQSGDSGDREGAGEPSSESGDRAKPAGDDNTGDRAPKENEAGREQRNQSDKPTGDQERSSTPTDTATPSGDRSRSDTPPSDSVSGSGVGSEGIGEAGDSPMQPDPVNVDYAKKAADMVLDYLEETRDAPDGELLEKLNWTKEDLQRFADRWQNVRDLGQSNQPDSQAGGDVEEALRSLGIRAPTEAGPKVRESADSLRGIRDAGNRKPPPAAFRDAFDAFRRAVGRN